MNRRERSCECCAVFSGENRQWRKAVPLVRISLVKGKTAAMA
jgi:hypothetical protein